MPAVTMWASLSHTHVGALVVEVGDPGSGQRRACIPGAGLDCVRGRVGEDLGDGRGSFRVGPQSKTDPF